MPPRDVGDVWAGCTKATRALYYNQGCRSAPPPDFDRSVNSISSTRAGQIMPTTLLLAPPTPPGFSDLPTALLFQATTTVLS